MKMIFLLALFILPASATAGPFGSLVKFENLNRVDQKGCEAGKIISQEYGKTGINILSGAPVSWSCTGVTAAQAFEKRCPYPQYTGNENLNIKCYSNSRLVGPVICLDNPRFESIEEEYADTGKVKRQMPRFNQLFVLSPGANGPEHRSDRFFKMDSSGCKVVNSRGVDEIDQSTYKVEFERCATDFYNATHGGPIDRGDNRRFCNPSEFKNEEDYADDYWFKTRELNHCFTDMPDFMNRYKEWRKNKVFSNQDPLPKRTSGNVKKAD